MENFILIFICLAFGMLLQGRKIFAENAPQTLNLYVIWVALPALILRQVPTLSFSTDLFVLLAMPWLMTLLGALLVWLGSRYFKWSAEITGVLLLTVPLGNTSFLGIPMIEAFFNLDMVSYGIIYDQFGSFLALSTYGSFIFSIYSKQEQQSVLKIAQRVLSFPPFFALLIAILFAGSLQNGVVHESLSVIASSVVPVVMFAIGLQLKIKMAPGQTLPFCFGLTVKMIIAPFAALLVCYLAGIDTPASRIAVFEAGMPPMVTAGALAMSAGLAPRLTAALVGWGIVISFATLSLIKFFL